MATDEHADIERAEEDRRRSEEAHWQVAETSAEGEERDANRAPEHERNQDDSENEGGG